MATAFVWLAVPYVNLVKNVEEWSKQLDPEVWTRIVVQSTGNEETAAALWEIPYLGCLPGLDFLRLAPTGWFNLTWLLLLLVFIRLIRRHVREPLPIVPGSCWGKVN